MKALVAAYPDSLLLKDSAGDLPLHLACRERSSKSVIGILLSEEPQAAKVKDDEGRLPLHLACRQGTPVQVVDSLIICYFRGSRTPDSYQLLPIHWACAQNASPAVVEALLRANPDSVDLKDKWGRTPLSLAQASTNSDKEKIIEALSKDPSYWNTNLAEEMEALTQKLEISTKKGKESEKKLNDFEKEAERKIHELEEESEMKVKELEEQNETLKEEIRILSSSNKYSEEDLTTINNENKELSKNIKQSEAKLKSYEEIFQKMEDQRVALLKITQEMEKTIAKATKLDSSKSSDDQRWKRNRNAGNSFDINDVV